MQELPLKNASTVTIKAGSRFRSSDNSEDIVFAIDFDVSLAAAGNGGLDAGSEASNTWYYLYVIKNPVSGASGAVLSTVNESVTGSITYPSGFTKKRQVRFASRNDASSNILPFVYRPSDAQIIYRDFEIDVSGSGIASGFSALNAGTATSWTAVSLGTFAPPASQRVVMSLSMWGDVGLVDRRFKIRPTGSGLSTGVLSISGASQFPSLSNPWVETPCSASQQIDYIGLGVNGALSFAVRGYYITEIS